MAYCWKCGREGKGPLCAYDGGAMEQYRPAPTQGYEHMWAVPPSPPPLSHDEMVRAMNESAVNARRK